MLFKKSQLINYFKYFYVLKIKSGFLKYGPPDYTEF